MCLRAPQEGEAYSCTEITISIVIVVITSNGTTLQK